MTALAFDFSYDEPAPVREDGVAPAPAPRRRLYAVRGTVDEPRTVAAAVVDVPPAAPVLRALPTPTLDDLLGRAWSALARGFAGCPVCHTETMTARWTAGHGVAGGRCASCGTTLE